MNHQLAQAVLDLQRTRESIQKAIDTLVRQFTEEDVRFYDDVKRQSQVLAKKRYEK